MSSARNRLLLFLILIILPAAGRWAWFYGGSSYQAPVIPEIDVSGIIPPEPVYQPFEDKPPAGNGRVIIDLSHNNNLEINDLSPLRDRLEARGVTVETIDGTGAPLKTQLHNATALIIIAPTKEYTAQERDSIVDFVEDGGRLLLAADPTRPVSSEDPNEAADLFSVLFPTSAVPATNSLANAFGVVYFDDYLYNLEDNEGNYRNVKFTNFNNEHPLTQNLETVVFFAAHSLRSDGLSLISGDKDTRSPVRSGETDLAAVALTTNGRVLALGDVTFLTAPFHTSGDNDIFLSHIADWLAVDERKRDDLQDFPYLFKQPVDLVQVSGDTLDPRLIVNSSALKEIFDQAGLSLSLQAVANPNHDALLIGAFDDLALVQDYLSTAAITVTLAITEEEESAEADQTEVFTEEEETIEPDETTTRTESPEDTQAETLPQITPSPTLTSTEEETETDIEDFLLEIEEKEGDVEETEEEEAKEEEEAQVTIEIETLGTIDGAGITLFIIDRGSARTTVIVLAKDSDTVIEALERLATNDLSGCAQSATVTVCSTGEVQDRFKPDTDDQPDRPDDEAGRKGDIFILSHDDGAEGTRTGAAELKAILSDSYDVTIWSTGSDGIPTSSDLAGYNAYIFDSGDYAFAIEDTDAFFSILDGVESGRLMLIGSQSLPSFEAEYEPIYDLKVTGTAHPLADGFTANEVIALFDSESGVPAVVISDDELPGSSDETEVIFTRGPDSPEAGTPALITTSDGHGGLERFIIAPFAFYRLPQEAQRTFALNAAEWLLGNDN